jgi:endonuclease/exonuclease/phosphatase family metal-dependent hydrolase
VKVLTFNVWGLPFARDRAARHAALVARLETAAADPAGFDLVLLQEAWTRKQRRALARTYPAAADADRFGDRWADRLLGPVTGGVDSGLITLSRWPVLEVRRHVFAGRGRWARVHRDGEVLARKSALAALIETRDLGRLWVVNTHLIADHPGAPHVAERLAQLAELAGFVRDLPGEAPVLLGGDLNCGPLLDGPNCGYAPEIWPEAIDRLLPGFVQAPEAAGPAVTAATWDTSGNSYSDGRGGPARLDHIFAGPGLEARNGRLEFDVALALPDGRRRHLSDHYGWSVEIAAADRRMTGEALPTAATSR